jgi:polyphosphate kinase 2 (PPK2 family)
MMLLVGGMNNRCWPTRSIAARSYAVGSSRLHTAIHTPTPELLIDKSAVDFEDPLPTRPEGLVTVLSALDMSPTLAKSNYRSQLTKQQGRLHLLQRQALQQGRSSILVFEGPDAAGKGGVIRRVIPTLDARNYRVLQFGAPTDEEAAHHYLWRFWRHLERAGRLTIFDRSWYGRARRRTCQRCRMAPGVCGD